MQVFMKKMAKGLISRTTTGKRLIRVGGLTPYLDEKGWFRSAEERLPVDRDGKPLPWYTYPMISFLNDRVKSDMHVFEYGSGNSTLWWSKQVSSVTSCEHDRKWYDSLKPKMPPNVNYIFCELDYGGQYCQTIVPFEAGFDCIIIDGRDRANCARNSLEALRTDGVIIWDNSDREKYQEGYMLLKQNGFGRIDFWGLGPLSSYEWCTSIFYRDDNCLGI